MTIVATDTALPSAPPAEKPPSTRFNIAIGIVAGLSAYFALGFDRTFAPHKIGWLFCPADRDWYYDPATYFLGWNYFRHSAWHLPPGLNPHYGLEYGSAIVYSDSLAIFALLLKPFNSILPQTFQYLGIWILTCFLLRGFCGALLASLFLVQAIPKLLVAGFFVISPIMLERAWTEYTLMGQWLLLWGIYLYFRPRPERLRWTWIILAAIAPLTSFYMAPMVLMLWGADLLKGLFLQRRPIRWLTIEAIAVPSVVLLVMWLGGFFAIPVKNGQTYGFGGFAANLLGFIDPLNASIFLKSLPKSPLWHGEGFCYLGLGIIFLGVIAVHELIRSGIPRFHSRAAAPGPGRTEPGGLLPIRQNCDWISRDRLSVDTALAGKDLSCIRANGLAILLRALARCFLSGNAWPETLSGDNHPRSNAPDSDHGPVRISGFDAAQFHCEAKLD